MGTTISLRSARFDSRYGTASSFGCQIVTIPKARKPALAPLSKVCRKRSELPPRCYNFITILRCLRNGPRKTVRLRQMASRSAVRQCRYGSDSTNKGLASRCAEEYWRRVARHGLWKTEQGGEQLVEQEAADCAQ